MKKIKGFIIMLVMVMAVVMQGNMQKAHASSKYIKVDDFIEYLVKQMNWEVDKSTDMPYVDVAMEKGILKKGDFKDYSQYLTRTDTAVIANRLDELVHLKHGYPRDVYEFLKDCSLFNNKLFYSTEGSLYPNGATRETYPEEIFHEEIVMPILGEYFNGDSWNDKGLRTGYEYIRDGEGNIIKRYMEVGITPERAETLNIDPFDKDSEIIKAWNIINDNERKFDAVLENRISDIKDIPKDKREAVASIVAKGIIKGYNNGLYVQNREFRGNNKITASGTKNIIQMVIKPETRAKTSPDGQLIRTTNLPKNASDYKYILESFPNKYYEMKHSFMYLTDYLSGEIRDDEYAYPKEVGYDFLYDNFYYNKMKLDIDKYDHYDAMLSNVEKYLEHILKVDYRTVNNKWKNGLAASLSFYSWDKSVYERIDRYIDNIKNNKVVVELDKIAIDPGAVYESRDYLYVRAYVKYRATAKDMNVDTNQLIFGSNTSIKNIKKGEWKEDIFDIRIVPRSEKNIYKWSPNANNSLSDWAYRESFK